MKSLIGYFVKRHMLANFILIGVFIGGVYFWHATSKEQMPNISFDRLSISVSYPGASPAEVEYFVTYPIEDAVRNLEGVKTVESTVGTGITNISLELDVKPSEKAEVINNIKSVVLSLRLPDDITDEPRFREFKTSQMAIVDIILYDETVRMLTPEKRKELQKVVDALETQLVNLAQVREVNKSGYLDEEIMIRIEPQSLAKNQISFSTVLSEIRKNNVRVPVGEIDDERTSKVTLKAELATVEELKDLKIQGNFSGNFLKLKDVADVYFGFIENKNIIKVNGHEAIELRVVKNTNAGIIEAVDAIKQVLEKFQLNHLQGSTVKLVLIDDESISVKDRISLIVQNGLLGFVLILLLLFIFLDFKSGIWVAIGIPFTMCFTLVVGSLLGLTINNITLASIIVVMGMVVDDAIVVAENIARKKSDGLNSEEASIEGTMSVIKPVVASIITTCLAFVPLLLFKGRMSRINQSMPLVISIMLGASLLESLFLLPGHLHLSFRSVFKIKKKKVVTSKKHWFLKVETVYGKVINKILGFKKFVFLGFAFLLLLSVWLFNTQLKFVMFPNEETTEVYLSATVPNSTGRMYTAKKSEEMEKLFEPYIGKEIIGVRTYVSTGIRGRAGRDNTFRMIIELVPKEKRKRTTTQLLAEWRKDINSLVGFDKVSLSAQRFGQQGGSPLEVVILENDDLIRSELAEKVKMYLSNLPGVKEVEIDEPIRNPEYVVNLRRDQVKMLGLSPESIGSTLRSVLSGTRVYTLIFDNKEVDVNLTFDKKYQKDIESVLAVPVETNQGYLVPVKNVVSVERQSIASSIERKQQKRLTKVFADIHQNSGKTPLDIATQAEVELLPELMSKNPSSFIYFGGEVQDSRESTNDFLFGVLIVLTLIYVILALLFNSLGLPFAIMIIIPFGVIGVIFAYYLHGIHYYGFFTLIGILGLIGVVVNDSIVMLSELMDVQREKKKLLTNTEIAVVAQTRLRAVLLTTLTTVAGLFPTAYGIAGYDSMLSEMMLAMGWGLSFGTIITLILTPSLFSLFSLIRKKLFGENL